MRRHATIILMVLLSLGAAAAAWGFTPGPILIRKCPGCNAALKQQSTLSGNTFGATFWSDGKMDAPMLPDRPKLVKCPKCGDMVWIDEAEKIGEIPLFQKKSDLSPTIQGAITPDEPDENQYLDYVASHELTMEKELYARTRAWWAANDAIRDNMDGSISFTPAQRANLVTMAGLLDENDPEQRLTMGEIFRELKDYDACIQMLANPFENDLHNEVAADITHLASQKIWRVSKIRSD